VGPRAGLFLYIGTTIDSVQCCCRFSLLQRINKFVRSEYSPIQTVNFNQEKEYSASYGPRNFITMLKKIPIPIQMNPVHVPEMYFFKICFNIVLPSMPKSSK